MKVLLKGKVLIDETFVLLGFLVELFFFYMPPPSEVPHGIVALCTLILFRAPPDLFLVHGHNF